MPSPSSKRKARLAAHRSKPPTTRSLIRRKKRRLSCTSVEDVIKSKRVKKVKRQNPSQYPLNPVPCPVFQSPRNDKLVIDEKFVWDRNKQYFKDRMNSNSDWKKIAGGATYNEFKCWIDELPQEILLKIFSYLPLGTLLHTLPQVCKKWELLALDWTLWKAVEDLTIKNMVISTAKLRVLLRTIPKLKKLELILRNDTEELLHELFESQQNLEVLKLDRCYRSALQMNILSQTVTSILENCPKLKTVTLTDTYFHSKNFYKCLAERFRAIERINVTCTTKSEMDVFMENLQKNIPGVEFQKVPMMGRADGKQIYWGPILGLVVRPIPTSPFHQQYIYDNYPNYAF